MKTLTLYLGLVAILGFATSGLAEVVDTWEYCDDSKDRPTNCTIQDLNIEPCREAADGEPCRIRLGHSAGIRFHFTPDFSCTSLQTRAYWQSPLGDLAFLGMNTNACTSTTCPATAGRQQFFNYTLPIASIYPTGVYDIKWKLWNTEHEKCCFRFAIDLTE